MAGETSVTHIGNLVADPELRFTPAGAAVVSFTVAANSRVFDRAKNEWRDGDPLFLRCSAWRQLAENIAESFHKGDQVIVVGRLHQRSYEAKDTSEKRSVIELVVDEVGASLRFATAKLTRAGKRDDAPPADDYPF